MHTRVAVRAGHEYSLEGDSRGRYPGCVFSKYIKSVAMHAPYFVGSRFELESTDVTTGRYGQFNVMTACQK